MVYPKDEIVSLIDTQIDTTVLLRDDDVTQAYYEVFVANPPHMQVKDFMLRLGKDVVITVADLRAENKRITGTVPLVEDGRYLVKTWTIPKKVNDSLVIDGIKLKQKVDAEIKRIFRAYPTDRYIVSWEANDRFVNATWIYCTIFTVAYMIQIIT